MKGYICLTLLLCAGLMAGNTSSDVFVVKDAKALQLYDKYQQPVPLNRLALYPAFSPWRITEADVVRADGFTRVSRVSDFRHNFSVALNDSGRPRLRYPTPLFYFKNCQPRADTLTVGASGRVRAGAITANPRRALIEGDYLPAGTVLELLFRYKGYLYAYLPGQRRYVWIARAARRHLTKTVNGGAAPGPVAFFGRELKKRIDWYNRKYRLLAEYLQSKNRSARPAPQWKLSHEADRWTIALEKPELAVPFRETMELFFKEMTAWAESYNYSARRRGETLVIGEDADD